MSATHVGEHCCGCYTCGHATSADTGRCICMQQVLQQVRHNLRSVQDPVELRTIFR